MAEHRQFDATVEEYERWNNGQYSHAEHVAHVREVVVAGQRLLHALGVEQVAVHFGNDVPTAPPNASLEEAALWALNYFEGIDRTNAQVHCAPVRYSPITFRLALALRDAWPLDQVITESMAAVLNHVGAYQPDPGR